ncbi:tripartite tricarboxylate transporter substrate binding protein [Fertoebacter nigrum]|uniref:Tripartite tricarboxylate transporter substrate binding protein n=1 Tax=Fertoeibacter niger TaxID=2656921 RepID=A0A8X8H3Z7_9RHOB|nr:tripartite tricarboxylate transporter substrate binding protein [Fertoeibacter niger]NUB45872.1 tripartite tricarboxylate transporter substrate binding protein [Fertoeibacter niger]
MTALLKAGLIALATTAPGAALAEWPVDKPITFVIPYGPGGGFDTIVRVLAPELEARLGTTVTPENIPGASGTRGGQAVARAEPDGYTIGIYNIPGLTVSQATETDIGFELGDVTWIANIASDRYALAVAKDSPITTVAELCALDRPIRLSDTGVDSTSSITAVISFSIIGCEIQNITGYSGSNETMIAVMRGEVDATLKPLNSMQGYLESGDLRLLATLSEEPLVEGIPTTTELGYPEISSFGLNRVVGGPPGMPEDLVKKLSDTFMEITASPKFVEWAASTDTGLLPLDAPATEALMLELAKFYEKYAPLLLQTKG